MVTKLKVHDHEPLPYQIGDAMVHPVHGIGVITGLDKIQLGKQSRLCYVMAIHDNVTLWVPVDAAAQCGLRAVATASGFKAVFGVLRSAAQPLSEQARDRQLEITERFKQGTLEAIGSIIRDLTVRGLSTRLNEHDAKMLRRTQKLLLDEWVLALGVPQPEAESQLNAMLHESATLSDRQA